MAARWQELAAPETGWRVLDVAPGAYTITGDSTAYPVDDPAALPLAEHHFDLVTCRYALRSFPDSFRFMLEAARLLRPGGILLLQDTLLPDDERAAGYVNAFLKLRDPRHIRAYAGYEWEGTALDGGFQVALTEPFAYTVPLLDLERTPLYTPYVIERLHILLKQAPPAVADWLRPRCPGTADAAFTHHALILKAVKPA
jgi:SAM-dependent methyltransferase